MKAFTKRRKSFFNILKTIALTFSVLFSTQLYSQIFIQAEDYADMYGTDTEGTSDIGGGINVGWIDNNDWLDYNIDIPVTGEYELSFRVASQGGGGILDVMASSTSLQTVDIAATGDWQNWTTVSGSSSISLTAGEQTLRLFATAGGFNLNWWKLTLTSPVDSDSPTTPIIGEASAKDKTGLLTWQASTDATSAIAGYQILKDKIPFAYAVDTFIVFSSLPYDKVLDLSIVANDIAGNTSDSAHIAFETDTVPWELAWSDEFDYEGEVDRTKWNFQTGGGGWGNGELQYYTDGLNASVSNGVLTIEARQETFENNNYTSTRMNSAGKGDFLYGRIEARAKLPSTAGTWPAFWTLPTNWVYGGWPDCGEIDIMEHSVSVGAGYGYVFGTVHTGAYNHQDQTQKSGGITFGDVTDTYHTYVIEWYPDHIDWYIDDNLIFHFENEYKTADEWPYDVAHHVLVNLAIGGGFGGDIDVTPSNWPQQYIVDYVRVYDFKLGENDTIAPDTTTMLKAEPDVTTADLSWYIAKDNYAIEKYNVFLDKELITSISYKTNNTLRGLEPETTYTAGIQAVDYAGNVSDTTFVEFTTLAEASSIDQVSGKSLSVYPNPLCGSSLTIVLTNDANYADIKITSTDGKVLIERKANSINGKIELTDINLKAGIYLISVTTENKFNSATLLVK